MNIRNRKTKKIFQYIGETVESTLASNPTEIIMPITEYRTDEVELAFQVNGKWVVNNSLGTVVLFKEGRKTYYLSKKQFEKDFEFVVPVGSEIMIHEVNGIECKHCGGTKQKNDGKPDISALFQVNIISEDRALFMCEQCVEKHQYQMA